LIIKRRVIVIALWIVVIIVGLGSASRLTGLLTTSLTVPNTGSAQANAILIHDFHDNVEGTFTVVVPFTNAISLATEFRQHPYPILLEYAVPLRRNFSK